VFEKFGEKVFSANVRGYLGSTRSRGNINNGIKDTALHLPTRFFAYNNGITALVHGYEVSEDGKTLELSGLAIVNGAQTTGAIGSVPREAIEGGNVLARFIHCSDAETVRNIIRFNNRQNPTEASDFRSNDRVQTRLVAQFDELGVVGYTGGRRGGAEDVIRRPAENQISATVAAQALAAFHRDPGLAYHEKGQIWESNQVYDRFFSDRTTARHILFCYSLLKAVEQARQDLMGKSEAGRTDSERRLAQFFRQRGSNLLLAAAIGACAEIYLDRQVPDPFRLQFRDLVNVPDAIARWRKLLAPALALAAQTLGPTLESEGSLRRREAVETAMGNFRSLFEATKDANEGLYADFAKHVELAEDL
jgi:AIPR protein